MDCSLRYESSIIVASCNSPSLNEKNMLRYGVKKKMGAARGSMGDCGLSCRRSAGVGPPRERGGSWVRGAGLGERRELDHPPMTLFQHKYSTGTKCSIGIKKIFG